MRFLDKMEKKFGRYAIQNISLMLIICYGFGYAIQIVNAPFLNYLTLNPYLVLRGQIWRLFTWIIIPPSGFDIFFTLISLYFYYWLGTTLERTWGTFRYNVFLIGGIFFTILGSFVLLAYYYIQYAPEIRLMGAAAFFSQIGGIFALFSTYYVNLSIFLAFALTFPEIQVRLFFVIPIRVKWLGIIDAALTLYSFFVGGPVIRIVIGASLLNVIIFFLATRNMMQMSPKQMRRRQVFRQEMRRTTGVTRHKCAICGRTEADGNLEFRYCSKCEGNYEYCQDHLFTHEHVKRH